MRKSHIYFFHNNLHFVNKTCWIMMIMAFGILMLGLYDLQVRRVLRYDQNQDERRCKKQRMQRENMETLGTPELFYFLGLEVLGTTWLTFIGYLAFYFPGTLGYPTRFYFIFILQILQNNFQSGWRNSCINMLFFPVFPTWLGTYNFILKIISV